ncbi:peptidase domain-containing ABC transporter [Chromobacterium sp. IIBBL 290-4]|uniref:peptidase domain-containing ABC transporter n=1 Tax=Chromobacterium sp. IIBBL 290-4 TaxID=2953890 RepID=UPI0020B815DC|nr:peptidase domain-containing ABC transporter [Chromobacterium sp. IIBBL 290-4]UTH75798.1 peptidase domain-containing ABC transporter [Chromobacterium sp. IIBBL 290-4]
MSHKQPILKFWGNKRLPMLLQTEAAECGLASLAMIAGYWGHHIDLANMRRRFSVSLKGATLKSLIAMAQGLGLQPRPLKLDMQHLPELKLPCVLHWDMNHFVVLKQVSRQYIVIHDPAVGERKLPLAEASKHFTGVALELIPGASFQKAEEKQKFSLLSLMGRVEGLGHGMSQLLLLGLALQVCALVSPFYLQWVVDEALVASDHDLVTVLGVGFLLLVLLQTAIGAVRSWVTTVLATNLNFQWLGNAFAHLLRLPLPWFEKRHLGDIVSRFGSIQTIQKSLTTQFVEGVIDGILVMATLGVMFLYSPSLAAVSLIAVALYVLLRWSIFRALREATAEQIIHAAKQNTHFIESARGVQSVRLFGRQEERRIGWLNALADQFNADLRIAKLSISFQTANTLLFSGERVIVVWLAALAVMNNQFSVGMLFAFLSYKDQFSQRIAALIDKLFELRMLRLHGERVADIVLTEPEQELNDVEIDPATVTPTIEVRNVAFRYSDSEPYVLKDMNLTVPAGQCLAITGSSGCGKTTLLKLMLGLMEPTEGEILIGGIPLKQLGLGNYRQLLGTVMQDDQLFAGSISDNICFFDPQPSQERIQRCAQLAAIHQEIMAMPMTYNTLVGDIGSGLSGGQKQRILLARSLYKQPKLLVLDEATSHLDVWNEKLVNAAVRDIAMTRLLVAHRPETIAMAERVVVLEQGKIVHDAIPRQPEAHPQAGSENVEQAG